MTVVIQTVSVTECLSGQVIRRLGPAYNRASHWNTAMRYRYLLPLLLAFALPAGAQDNACPVGMVWVDSNGNGQWDNGEKGLSGVKVSDGQHVVVTDARGQYDLPLPAGEGRTLFVIKPAGYDFPARSDGLPSFWIND